MTEISLFEGFAKGDKSTSEKRGTNCVIYTRVSTKEQADTNLSLETQQKACNQYAQKFGYPVLATFGGTYESAQTDERKEFTAMLSFVKKSRQRISYIIVYSLERFSRNDNSIWLSGQLRKLGVEIVSVTQPIDTSNPSGQMQQKMLFLFGEFDNQLRKQKCMAGVKEMLLRGDWPTSPPVGYDIVKVNSKRKIVVNAKGKLLRQAFEWRAEGMSSEAVRARLAEKGFRISNQLMSVVLRNPFYCGLMAHNMLEGKLVPGNHEQLISKELFLKVNGIMVQKHASGYKVNEENEAIPLKRFLQCDHCGRGLRGYIVKKKNIHYYKCNTTGCGNNKNAGVLHKSFASILEYFKFDLAPDALKAIREQAIATFNQLTEGSEDEAQQLHKQYKEINIKIERLEERFIDEEINAELYNKFYARYMAEKKEIEQNLAKSTGRVSNLEECVDLTLQYAAEMPSRWHSSDYSTKQRLQFLVFPDGISYHSKTDRCRTSRINIRIMYKSCGLDE